MRQLYPAHRAADGVLRDGSTVPVRLVHPEDKEAIRAFYQGLSVQACKLWFPG
ncbi:MAG: hypothetical protein ACK42I_01130 [Thermomicrobium sp.]